jgi:ABC-2 type transport system ATP-binding protein
MDEAEYCNRIALINRGRLIALGTPQELKRGSLDGELLAIEGEQGLAGAIGLLQGAPGVRDVAVFGSTLHVVVDDAARRAPELVARLDGRGIQGAAARRIEASMEDSFVHLVGAASKSEGAAP